ncbi:MAG: DinB family protein [Planctomycetota bacterium]
MTLASALLADFDRETVLTRRILDAVPEDRLPWRPHAKSWTLAQLASHIAEAPSWASSMFEDEMDFAAMADYRPFEAKDKQELLQMLDKNVAECRAALQGRDDAAMRGIWTARMGDKVLMQEPRHQVLRTIAIHHWIQHRGQLQVYLRLCDAVVPPTYGPTADVAEWS